MFPCLDRTNINVKIHIYNYITLLILYRRLKDKQRRHKMVSGITILLRRLFGKVTGQSVSKISHVDVIKMREMRGEVGKKTSEKEMDNPSFL